MDNYIKAASVLLLEYDAFTHQINVTIESCHFENNFVRNLISLNNIAVSK